MREGRPSFTAVAVAAARAVAGVDRVAPELLDGPLGWAVRAGRAGRARVAVLNAASLGLVDHLELRTRAIDVAVSEGVAAGAAQLVLLGAGLDARAWRMQGLADVSVYEVDHPSTQAYKRVRIGSRVPAARGVRFVPVDFAKDSLEEALALAGHDGAAPTFWVWEGVTPYLPAEARRTTLAAVAARSAAGSRVAITYVTPEATAVREAVARLAVPVFKVLGEAILGTISPEAMREELAEVAYRVLDDASARDWAVRYGGGRRRLLLVSERLVVAVTGGPPRASRAA